MKNITHVILGVVAVLLGVGLFFIPQKDNSKKESPEFVHLDMMDNSRLLSTDELAEKIINKDPILLPVDVRSSEEYDEFTIPGAVNIPLEKMLDEESEYYLALGEMEKVFFSNDDLSANQAWMMAKRKGYKNVYVLKGGLNEWVETILQPIEPPLTASEEEFNLYNLRKASQIYFIGGSEEFSPEDFEELKTQKTIAKKKIQVAPPPKAKKVVQEEEGC